VGLTRNAKVRFGSHFVGLVLVPHMCISKSISAPGYLAYGSWGRILAARLSIREKTLADCGLRNRMLLVVHMDGEKIGLRLLVDSRACVRYQISTTTITTVAFSVS
jgi:hypothetical protein